MGGKRPYALAGERDWLLARLSAKPDLTLHALLAELRQRGVVVACDTLWRFLRREGQTIFDIMMRTAPEAMAVRAVVPDYRGGSGIEVYPASVKIGSRHNAVERPTRKAA